MWFSLELWLFGLSFVEFGTVGLHNSMFNCSTLRKMSRSKIGRSDDHGWVQHGGTSRRAICITSDHNSRGRLFRLVLIVVIMNFADHFMIVHVVSNRGNHYDQSWYDPSYEVCNCSGSVNQFCRVHFFGRPGIGCTHKVLQRRFKTKCSQQKTTYKNHIKYVGEASKCGSATGSTTRGCDIEGMKATYPPRSSLGGYFQSLISNCIPPTPFPPCRCPLPPPRASQYPPYPPPPSCL